MPEQKLDEHDISLPKLGRTRLVEGVIDALRSLIEAPETMPGRRLPSESELAKGFGVGRSTVREALQVLGHLGLIESRNGRGTFVRSKFVQEVSRQNGPTESLETILQFREYLESAAAGLAAERCSKTDAENIKSLWKRACRSAEAEKFNEFVDADYAFHCKIIAASRNEMMLRAYEREERNIRYFISAMLELSPVSRMTYVHDDLVTAILGNDKQGAVQATQNAFREAYFRLSFVNQRSIDTIKN